MMVRMSQNSEQQAVGADVAGTVLAANLRRLRSRSGLSLAELGSRAGLSRTTVHEIEQGGANPRLETLYSLATVLGVGLAELLEGPPKGRAGWVMRADQGSVVNGEAIEARLLGRVPVDGHIEIYDFTVHDGLQRSAPHAEGVRECLIVHDGMVNIGPTAEQVELGPGDAILFDGTGPHVYGSTAGGGRGTLLVLHQRPAR